MTMLRLDLSGYIAEVGNLGMGLKGGKPGRGITLEVGDTEVVISGLTKEQCKEAAKCLRQRVQITILSAPSEDAVTGDGT